MTDICLLLNDIAYRFVVFDPFKFTDRKEVWISKSNLHTWCAKLGQEAFFNRHPYYSQFIQQDKLKLMW